MPIYKQGGLIMTLQRPYVYQNTYRYSEVLDWGDQGRTQRSNTNGGFRGKTGAIKDKTSGYSQLIARTVLKFNKPGVDNLVSIDWAVLHMWKHWDSNYPVSGTAYTHARQVTAWSENPSGWDSRPWGLGGILSTDTDKRHGFEPSGDAWHRTFDVTDAVRNWYINGYGYEAIQLDSMGEESGSDSWKKWWLDNGYEPRIEVHYTYWEPDPPNVLPDTVVHGPETVVVGSSANYWSDYYDPDGSVDRIDWGPSDWNYIAAFNFNWNSGTVVFKKTGQCWIGTTVTDNRGGQDSHAVLVNVVLPPNNNPIADFTISKYTAKQDEVVTIIDKSYDPDSASTNPYYSGSIVSRVWSWPAGHTDYGNSQHSFANVGTYTIRLTITDDQGGTGYKEHTLTIIPKNNPPVASFSTNSEAVRGSSIPLIDGSYDPDPGQTLTKVWSCNPSAGVHFAADKSSVYFDNLGSHTITLTVTDNGTGNLSSSMSKTVNVINRTGTPSINFPINGSTIYNRTPYIHLTGAADADGSYDPSLRLKIDFCQRYDFASGVISYDTISYQDNIEPSYLFSGDTSMMFKAPSALSYGTWHVRVYQYDGHNWSNYRQLSFTIANTDSIEKNSVYLQDLKEIRNMVNIHRNAYGLQSKTWRTNKSFSSSVIVEEITAIRTAIEGIMEKHNSKTSSTKLNINLTWRALTGDVELADFTELIDNLTKV